MAKRAEVIFINDHKPLDLSEKIKEVYKLGFALVGMAGKHNSILLFDKEVKLKKISVPVKTEEVEVEEE